MTPSDLVEAAARALAGHICANTEDDGDWGPWKGAAEAALASIGIPLDRLAQLVSGEAWIAPREPTQAMIEASREFTYDPAWPEEPVNIYRAMRDRYLIPEVRHDADC